MKAVIDTERCTGHGRCYFVAPHLFEDDDRGFGALIGDGEVSEEHRDEARQAVRACPEQAIKLVE
jgi:ferredoxin